MFSEAPVLIAEDNLYLSLDLSGAVEGMGGRVVGPASSVPEALASSPGTRSPRRSSTSSSATMMPHRLPASSPSAACRS